MKTIWIWNDFPHIDQAMIVGKAFNFFLTFHSLLKTGSPFTDTIANQSEPNNQKQTHSHDIIMVCSVRIRVYKWDQNWFLLSLSEIFLSPKQKKIVTSNTWNSYFVTNIFFWFINWHTTWCSGGDFSLLYFSQQKLFIPQF